MGEDLSPMYTHKSPLARFTVCSSKKSLRSLVIKFIIVAFNGSRPFCVLCHAGKLNKSIRHRLQLYRCALPQHVIAMQRASWTPPSEN